MMSSFRVGASENVTFLFITIQASHKHITYKRSPFKSICYIRPPTRYITQGILGSPIGWF